MGKSYEGYDGMIRSLTGDLGSSPGNRQGADEIEMFVTSEDKAKEAKLREEQDPRNYRRGTSAKPEESVYFRYTDKRRVRKYSEEELASFREGAKRVIVHDYGERDFYHLTDEERERNDRLASLSLKLGGLKRIYRSVDKYVEAMRVVYEAWSMLAENNPLHTKEEFFEYVANGMIVSQRIITPKLKGIDSYNKDLILTYIANPELDPKELVPQPPKDEPDDFVYQDLDEQRFEMDCLLDPDEIEYVATYDQLSPAERERLSARPIGRKFLKAYDDRQGLGKRKRATKGLKKVERDLQPDLTAILKKLVRSDANHDPYGTMTNFNSLAELFDRAREETVWDRYPYRGSWQDDLSSELYDLAISEARMMEPVPGDPGITYSDLANQKFYRKLEEVGVSTVEMRRSGDGHDGTYLKEKLRRSRKANRRMERKIINKIVALQERPKFKKLIERSEKSLERYRTEKAEEDEY